MLCCEVGDKPPRMIPWNCTHNTEDGITKCKECGVQKTLQIAVGDTGTVVGTSEGMLLLFASLLSDCCIVLRVSSLTSHVCPSIEASLAKRRSQSLHWKGALSEATLSRATCAAFDFFPAVPPLSHPTISQGLYCRIVKVE
jgi:hypothetical protein